MFSPFTYVSFEKIQKSIHMLILYHFNHIISHINECCHMKNCHCLITDNFCLKQIASVLITGNQINDNSRPYLFNISKQTEDCKQNNHRIIIPLCCAGKNMIHAHKHQIPIYKIFALFRPFLYLFKAQAIIIKIAIVNNIPGKLNAG